VLELPALDRFSRDAELQGVRVVTVVSGEEVPKARRLLAALSYSFPVVMDDDNRLADDYRVAGVPQTVVVKDGRVASRFVGEGRHARLTDALRAETGAAEVEDAGGTGEPSMTLVERDGRYVATDESAKGWSVPINRGKWTRMPDGPYLDPTSGDVIVVATSRGPAFTAGNAAATRANSVWQQLVAAACPARARITGANLDALGAFGASTLKFYAGWPRSEVAAQVQSCDSQMNAQVLAAPSEARGAQRIAFRIPADTVVYEKIERWRDSTPGETRPVGPQLRNHFAEVQARLRAEGRILAEALR